MHSWSLPPALRPSPALKHARPAVGLAGRGMKRTGSAMLCTVGITTTFMIITIVVSTFLLQCHVPYILYLDYTSIIILFFYKKSFNKAFK